MRKILICLSFWVFLFSSLPVFAAEVEPLEGIAVITSDKLNIRSGPSKDYAVLGVLSKDTSVDVKGIVEPDWYVIEHNGEQGFIHSDYVVFTPADEIEAAPDIDMKQYLVMGLVVAIFLVAGLMIYTFISMYSSQKRKDMEEEEEGMIPVTNHDDTNMHIGEVTYDTYRLDIDPSFFETTTILPQPESIYAEREVTPETDIQALDTRLEQASAQIAALQKEVEELKKQKPES